MATKKLKVRMPILKAWYGDLIPTYEGLLTFEMELFTQDEPYDERSRVFQTTRQYSTQLAASRFYHKDGEWGSLQDECRKKAKKAGYVWKDD